MRPNEADSRELSMAKSTARLIISRYGVEAAALAIERALGIVPPPAPKVAATAPITVAAAPAASTATDLSTRMPYQPAVIPPQIPAAISTQARVAITDAALRIAHQPDRSIDTPRAQLKGLAAIWASGQPLNQEGDT
jgi:hypothetical protein